MIARVPVTRSSEADAPTLRRLAAQRTTADAAGAERMAPALSPRLPPPFRALPPRGASQQQLRDGVTALQRAVAARRTLARDGQDPGPPEMPDMKGITCGVKDGKLSCSVYTGKGDPVDIDTSTFSPEEKQAALDPKRPKSCPPERWNWFWGTCCLPGKRLDARQRSCVDKPKVEEPLFDLPPPVPEEKGDFPLPSTDPTYA